MLTRLLNTYAERESERSETVTGISERLVEEKINVSLESVLGPPVPSEDIEVIDPAKYGTQSADEESDKDTEE